MHIFVEYRYEFSTFLPVSSTPLPNIHWLHAH